MIFRYTACTDLGSGVTIWQCLAHFHSGKSRTRTLRSRYLYLRLFRWKNAVSLYIPMVTPWAILLNTRREGDGERRTDELQVWVAGGSGLAVGAARRPGVVSLDMSGDAFRVATDLFVE